MDWFFIPYITALWLGILTSISPCPLATNITAISYIGKNAERPSVTLFTGIAYTLGRSLAYILIASLLVTGILSVPSVSYLLQKYLNMIVGPLLIVIGMVLLDLFAFKLPWSLEPSSNWQIRLANKGYLGAFLMGILFALSFCPSSAALFFGSLIPLAIQQHSLLALPLLYGMATGIPVLVFTLILAFGIQGISKIFSQVTRFEKYGKGITGVVFILVGLYMTLTYVYGINF